MGFFDFFKSKEQIEMERMVAELEAKMFPCGQLDLVDDVTRVLMLTKGKIPDEKIIGFVKGCKTIVFISERDDTQHIESILARSNNMISRLEAQEVYAYLAGESSYYANQKIGLMSMGIAKDTVKQMVESQSSEYFANSTYKDTIPGGDENGDFGYSDHNPIPTISSKGEQQYLERLRRNGRSIQYKRIGSGISPLTKGPIDIFDLYQDGRKFETICFSPFHKKNSTRAPSDLKLS